MRVLLLTPPTAFARNVARDLVYGCWCKGKRIAGASFPPMTLVQVGTILKENGHSVELLDCAGAHISADALAERANDFDLAVVLTSAPALHEDAAAIALLKQRNPELRAFAFGGEVKADPKTVLAHGFDFACTGEADWTLRDLVAALAAGDDAWKQTKGLAYIEDGAFVATEPMPLVKPLDSLPMPDRSLLDPEVHYFNPLVKRMPYTTMFTSRGCPAKCSFCSSPWYYGEKVRMRSAALVFEEMKQVVAQGFRQIFFRDEIFTVSRQRVMDLCDLIIEAELDITWLCSARADTLDQEMLAHMRRAGCHMVRIGVESGVQELLDAVHKGVSVERIQEVFAAAHAVGMDTHAHMMIGLPGETHETVARTFEFIKGLDPTTATYGILTVYPGTPLFDEVKAMAPEIGEGIAKDFSSLHTTSYYNERFTTLTPEDLHGYLRKAYRQFYARPSYIYGWLKRLDSLDEFKRVSLAGTQVFSFIAGQD